MEDFRRAHIPAFGNWDYGDGVPITQYFESARQAGLVRYAGYGEELQGDLYSYYPYCGYQEADLYLKPTVGVHGRKTKAKGRDGKGYQISHAKEPKRQVKVHDLAQTTQQLPTTTLAGNQRRAPKAVDEDLYKIPPELLYATYPKKKKRAGFLFRCFVPCYAA